MSSLVLRLAAPLQSWSGYRHQVNMQSSVPTAPVPRKSAMNGLIGAALGPHDSGHGSARDLNGIGRRYELDVRVEARNPDTEDFQVLGPLSEPATARAERIGKLATASTSAFPSKRGGGNFPITPSRRDYLSHAEFIAVITADAADISAWLRALRHPVFMPYLGRKSCAPTFPFLLGRTEDSVAAVFSSVPHVDKYGRGHLDDAAPLTAYSIGGDYDLHVATPHRESYKPPTGSRTNQLAWAQKELCR